MEAIKIRDNKKIIIGLTGYSGSGSSSLAHIVAFQFNDYLNNYLNSFNKMHISDCFRRLSALKETGIDRRDELVKEFAKLKGELEERQIIEVLERYETELLNNSFYYISFSQIIMLFVIKYLNDCMDKDLVVKIENKLNEVHFKRDEAQKITRIFFARSGKIRELEYINRFVELFKHLSKIRNIIVELYGKAKLQDYGDNIRKYGNPFKEDKPIKGLNGRWLAIAVDRYINMLTRLKYKYFIIESFRNPQELYYFREKYSFFYLVAVVASREDRLRWSKIDKTVFEGIERREIKNDDIRSLNVSRCIDIADIVISNDGDLNGLFQKLLRYTTLILEPGCIKPTQSESLMHLAYGLSVRSNCLSRQVGAVITNSDGYVIGAGWNDVGEGQLSCGIKKGMDYEEEYLKDDSIKIDQEENGYYVCVKKKYGETECPVVLHAEENAIMQLAMYGSGNSKASIIYTTTYPCPHCLKKISQIGVREVVFVEEYPNKLKKVYTDQNIKKITFTPFQGVKSNSYYKLYKPYYDKKEQQYLLK